MPCFERNLDFLALRKISDDATNHEDIQVKVEESKNEIEHVDQNEGALYIPEGTLPSLDL